MGSSKSKMAKRARGDNLPTIGKTAGGAQTDKVFFVTNGEDSIAVNLATRLYALGGTVYLTSSSEAGLAAVKSKITASPSKKGGKMETLVLDLEDFQSIKAAVDTFKAKEKWLNVLFNHAALKTPVATGLASQEEWFSGLAKSAAGVLYLTKLLQPSLHKGARNNLFESGRVVWTGYSFPEFAERLDSVGAVGEYSAWDSNWFLATELKDRQEWREIPTVVAETPRSNLVGTDNYEDSLASLLLLCATQMALPFLPNNAQSAALWLYPKDLEAKARALKRKRDGDTSAGDGIALRFWEIVETRLTEIEQ